jgi:hypothetical protein
MWSVTDQIGLHPVAPATAGVAQSTQAAAMTEDDMIGPLSLGNPLLWLGAFMLVTVGAASLAGSVRIGKVKVSAAAGK